MPLCQGQGSRIGGGGGGGGGVVAEPLRPCTGQNLPHVRTLKLTAEAPGPVLDSGQSGRDGRGPWRNCRCRRG